MTLKDIMDALLTLKCFMIRKKEISNNLFNKKNKLRFR